MSENLNAKNMNLLKLQRYQQHNHDDLVRLGTPTWETTKFKGTLYDFDTPVDEFLKAYASQYDTVEFLQSFFDSPSERVMKELRSEVEGVNKNFRFCPVIPRRISHEFEWGENIYDLKEFIEAIDCLGPHLGPCILRLPEIIAPEKWKTLLKFIKIWPVEKRLAIHLTHAEWFKKTETWSPLVKELTGTNVSILIEDRIELPVRAEKLLTSDHLILRYFGRLNQDDQRLALWVYKLGEFKGYGVKDSFFILHEQEEMCLSLLRRMANSMGGNVRIPSSFDLNTKQTSFLF
jgi:uncharacterized protein YecE (DUF72 family)